MKAKWHNADLKESRGYSLLHAISGYERFPKNALLLDSWETLFPNIIHGPGETQIRVKPGPRLVRAPSVKEAKIFLKMTQPSVLIAPRVHPGGRHSDGESENTSKKGCRDNATFGFWRKRTHTHTYIHTGSHTYFLFDMISLGRRLRST